VGVVDAEGAANAKTTSFSFLASPLYAEIFTVPARDKFSDTVA